MNPKRMKRSMWRGAVVGLGVGIPGALLSAYFDAVDQGFWVCVIIGVSIILFDEWRITRDTSEKRITEDEN